MKNQIIDVIKRALEIEDREINMDDHFRDYDEWDSLGRLSLIAEIDTEFEVQIEEEDFEKIQTIEELAREITSRVGK